MLENDLRRPSIKSSSAYAFIRRFETNFANTNLNKILESFIDQRMLQITTDNFDRRQYGALKGWSTVHALIDIFHTCHQALETCVSVRVLIADYSKAFDHVDPATVLSKMASLGRPPFIWKWMHSFLYKRKQRAKISDIVSSWTTLNDSIAQGTWLGPNVFLILLSYLETYFKFVYVVILTEILVSTDTLMCNE